MTRPAFKQALLTTLAFEGGAVNDPRDPGKATVQGVTQATYDDWREAKNLHCQPVTAMRQDERDAIYCSLYWTPIEGDRLPLGLAIALFDFAVNSGPKRAIETLQAVMGMPPSQCDGDMGPLTLREVTVWAERALITTVCNARLEFDKTLHTWTAFGKGWETRINALKAHCLSVSAINGGKDS